MNQTVIRYAKWLNTMEWDYWCTFTTSYSLTCASARRAMNRFYSILKKRFFGLRVFWVAEPFVMGGGYHVHALVHLNIETPTLYSNGFNEIKSVWEIASGAKDKQHLKIENFDKSKGAVYYLVKHLSKAKCDYDLFCP
jgi:hypothetical protein